jgi:hypothetical protein
MKQEEPKRRPAKPEPMKKIEDNLPDGYTQINLFEAMTT